jgi:hypothetical protein
MKKIIGLLLVTSFLSCKSDKHNPIIGEWELITFYLGKKQDVYRFDPKVSALIPDKQDFIIEYKEDNTFVSKDYAFKEIKVYLKGKYQLIANNKIITTQMSDNGIITDTSEYSISNDTLLLVLPQDSPDSVMVQKLIKWKQ